MMVNSVHQLMYCIFFEILKLFTLTVYKFDQSNILYVYYVKISTNILYVRVFVLTLHVI